MATPPGEDPDQTPQAFTATDPPAVHPRATLKNSPFSAWKLRSRLAKPTSPWSAMAEIRRGAARGRKHLSPELKGRAASALAKNTKAKSSARNKELLAAIPENNALCIKLDFEDNLQVKEVTETAIVSADATMNDVSPSTMHGGTEGMEMILTAAVSSSMVSERMEGRSEDSQSEMGGQSLADHTGGTAGERIAGDGNSGQPEEAELTVAMASECKQKSGEDLIESQMQDKGDLDGSGCMAIVGKQTSPPSQVKLGSKLFEEKEGHLMADNLLHPKSKDTPLILAESDYALDLVTSQPLQDMRFIADDETRKNNDDSSGLPEGVLMMESGNLGARWAVLEERNLHDNQAEVERMDVEFPPLNKERLKMIKDKFENRGRKEQPRKKQTENHPSAGENSASVQTSQGHEDNRYATQRLIHGTNVEGTKGNNSKNYKPSIAEVIKTGVNEPIIFEPEKIKKIGIIGESSGVPSIYFSGSDTNFLAEKLGHAIVGKFSHSIPSAQHIQRALQGMKFVGDFTWRYINAKHVLIQFNLISDYAKLLSGPNGMPVWFIDRHPMRVFKWTPEFDPFFESPIAAVWCNLIGLPLHLFEKSALFAIGSLLGVPIQVDHATIAQTRLSFARLCIEIDISMPPTEEIILDLQGREVRQSVKWDRIPLYCRDCKHVGHTWDTCYANGQREKPMKRDYNNPPDKWQQHGYWRKGEKAGPSHSGKEPGPNQKRHPETPSMLPNFAQDPPVNPSPQTELTKENTGEAGSEQDEEGFQKQGRRRRGRNGKGGNKGKGVSRTSSQDRDLGVVEDTHEGGGIIGSTHMSPENMPPTLRTYQLGQGDGTLENLTQGIISNPRYFRLLPNGDFDTEAYEEENDWEMEEEIEDEHGTERRRLLDKRESATGVSKTQSDDGKNKKVRLITSASTSTF